MGVLSGRRREPTVRSAKVGTQPWLIVLRGNAKPAVGRQLAFREHRDDAKWLTGYVTAINDDGYLFIDLV
jgi:hypothetical protein